MFSWEVKQVIKWNPGLSACEKKEEAIAREVRGELGKLWTGVRIGELLAQTGFDIQIQGNFPLKSKYLAYLKKSEGVATPGLYAYAAIATWDGVAISLFRQGIMFQVPKVALFSTVHPTLRQRCY